ncbi:MAG: hypothetical protein OXT68_03510 [Chloroflexota bacterium]|nr:hypothetical protein [Chloroflexota bacterium]
MQIDRITKFSRGYAPQLDQLLDSTYVHKFREDVRLQILPVRVSKSEPSAFEFVPGNEDLLFEVAILFAEPYQFLRYGGVDYRTEVAEIVDKFVRFVASDLAIKGVSFWEIATASEQKCIKDPSPALVWISGDVQERRQYVRQSRTRLDETSFDETTVDLPKKKAIVFRLPEHLGSSSAQRLSLEILEKASKIVPTFYSEKLGELSYDSDFVLKDSSYAKHRAVTKAMRNWGWMSTIWEDQYVTDFYSAVRYLKFHQVLADLRSEIICKMNAVLKQLGIETKIIVNGLLSAEEIQDLMINVYEGAKSFNQAMEPIRSQLLG